MKILNAFQCVVMMSGGKLYKCELGPNGLPDMWAGSINWREVKGPVNQDFIEAVNQALGVHLTQEQLMTENAAEKKRT